MKRITLLVLIAGVATLFAVPAHAATLLRGTTGPSFVITLKKGTTSVTKLKAGTYAIRVSDRASIHNFHLFGPGVNKRITSVSFVGTKIVTVTLRPGRYTYQCDPHAASGMKHTFRVVR
jgi:plastocyanin